MSMTEKLIRNEQEAIECLKKNKPTSGYYMLQESVDMAIQALEKQIPMKPQCRKVHDSFLGEVDDYYCTCGNALAYHQLYCDRCGQAIDRSK